MAKISRRKIRLDTEKTIAQIHGSNTIDKITISTWVKFDRFSEGGFGITIISAPRIGRSQIVVKIVSHLVVDLPILLW